MVDSSYVGVPEQLRTALLATHESLPERRIDALRELARLADPRSLDRLEELLGDSDGRVRCATAETIGWLGIEGRPCVEALAPLLDDSSLAVRQCALLALARVGGNEALEQLLAFLVNAYESELEEAIDALGRLGRIEAVPEIVQHLDSAEPSVVAATVRAIERIGPGGASLVEPYLSSDSPAARCAAASILARWERLDDEQPIHRMSRSDRDEGVRICALGALGRLGDANAVERLTRLIADEDRDQRERAARALGVAGTDAAVDTLIHALTSFHDDDHANAAQAALLSIGRSARLALEGALPTGPPLRRVLVAETLGLLGDPAAIPSLERAAMDTDAAVRQAATTALEVLRRN